MTKYFLLFSAIFPILHKKAYKNIKNALGNTKCAFIDHDYFV